MSKLNILVVEDNVLAREVMAEHLAGQVVDFAADRPTAERKLKAGHYDICFIDLVLGEGDDYSGLKLIPLAASRGSYPVVMSSCDTEETISRAYALGCKEFYVKGDEAHSVAATIARYMRDDGGKSAQKILAAHATGALRHREDHPGAVASRPFRTGRRFCGDKLRGL